MKKKILKVLICVVSVLVCVLLAGGIFLLAYTPTLTFDVQHTTGPVTSGASGYLYGLAEHGVPSEAMCESVDISSVSQKAIDGLQHPIGDIDHVAGMLGNTDYNVVYIQDAYDTWYYKHDEIMQMRAQGTYDWQAFLDEDFLPKVRQTVEKLSAKEYGEKVVYCLYNECDNGVWFGETRYTDDPNNRFGVWAEYNTVGRDTFNSAWKQAYEAARLVNPDCLIGGPGFCDYNHDEIQYFLQYCVENNCVPDIMIYHELHDDSVYYWQNHVDDYREIERKLGITELPIIVTEYGRMQDNGYPGKMVQYITRIENSKVYANNAYWRLSNNLNDVCADDNSPNANWWLMRWYADLEGETLASVSHDLFKSDFERSVRNRKKLDHQGFMGIAALDTQQQTVTVVCGGRDNKAKVVFDNLQGTVFEDRTLRIRIEETVYKGLYGIVSESVLLEEYTTIQKGNRLTVSLTDLDEANAYRITVSTDEAGSTCSYRNDNRPQRYEFEHGTLLGDAYLYDSYCPTSGDTMGMVGGMEKPGDGISLLIDIPTDGEYRLDFVYGNANDGPFGENGRQNPNDRTDALAVLSVDGAEQILRLPNTIKSEYTSCYSLTMPLQAGAHQICVSHEQGTYVLDSLLVTKEDADASVALMADADRTNAQQQSFLAVAPADGTYLMQTDALNASFLIDGAQGHTDAAGAALVCLRRGLNYIDFAVQQSISVRIEETEQKLASVVLTPDMAVLDGASLKENENGVMYIDCIDDSGSSALYRFSVPSSGDYRVTLQYANNDEGGVHDYNVDLIERYVTVHVNGEFAQNVFCRNTYAWTTFKTVTFHLALQEGENELRLSNDGSVRFNGNRTAAPYIACVSVTPVA